MLTVSVDMRRARRCKPTHGTIARTLSSLPLRSLAFLSHSSAVKDGKARTIGQRCSRALIIAANGFRLLRPAFYEIMDTAPRGKIVHLVREAAAKVPGVIEIDKSFVRKMGLSFYVDIHVGVNESISVREGHDIAHAVKDAIRATDARIADVLVHIEPADVTR